MTTVASVVDRVLRKFQSRDTPDILEASMTDTQGTISYRGFLPAWGPGSLIQVGEERMLVTENDDVNHTATVVRGWDGTTAAAHTAGEPIILEPRGDRGEVVNLINDCLNDMFPELFRVDAVEVDYSASIIGYEIPNEAHRILQVSALTAPSALYWEPIFDWHIEDNADTGHFSTGKAIMINTSLPVGGKFRVKYGTTFTPVTGESQDLETDAGLDDYMVDLPYYYALSRLLPGEEQLRSQIHAAENHQRAQDVPGFLALRTGEWYQARYADRKLAAAKTLAFKHKQSRGTGYGS